MPIAAFENGREAPLTLVVEPSGDKFEIPHLATAGVRYALKEGEEDYSTSVVQEREVQFWCNADSFEVDIVHPSDFDRLLWDICVTSGFCGGIVDGEPTHVQDLIPKAGLVSADDFAGLAIKAEGGPPPGVDQDLRWRRLLGAKFTEHFGPDPVPAERLMRNLDRPFGNAPSL